MSKTQRINTRDLKNGEISTIRGYARNQPDIRDPGYRLQEGGSPARRDNKTNTPAIMTQKQI